MSDVLPTMLPDGSFPLWPGGAPRPDGVDSDQVPRIVPFPLKSSATRGAVIVLPGGGYCMLAPHEADPVAEFFNREGIAAFVAYYRISPHKHAAPLLDVQRAIRFARFHAKRWNINPDKIAILGFSAGGHAASTAATHFDDGNAAAADPIERVSCRPDAAILCYPVITFGVHGHDGCMTTLLGENPSAELRRNLSNELQVTPRTPPTFLWHAMGDEAVPVENSLLFASALSRNKVPFELHVFQCGGHGAGLAESDPVMSAWPKLCATWLKQNGF